MYDVTFPLCCVISYRIRCRTWTGNVLWIPTGTEGSLSNGSSGLWIHIPSAGITGYLRGRCRRYQVGKEGRSYGCFHNTHVDGFPFVTICIDRTNTDVERVMGPCTPKAVIDDDLISEASGSDNVPAHAPVRVPDGVKTGDRKRNVAIPRVRRLGERPKRPCGRRGKVIGCQRTKRRKGRQRKNSLRTHGTLSSEFII